MTMVKFKKSLLKFLEQVLVISEGDKDEPKRSDNNLKGGEVELQNTPQEENPEKRENLDNKQNDKISSEIHHEIQYDKLVSLPVVNLNISKKACCKDVPKTKISSISIVKISTPVNNNTKNDSDSTHNPEAQSQGGIFNLKNKKPAGYLILLSGAIHNIIDGIAVGIAFASRKVNVIVSTNIAIILHEIPKEMGDAGILLSSNFSPWSVLFWNVSNNFTNIIGTIIGLAIGEITETANAYCLGFVAGNFFYIALAEMVPEMMKKKGVWTQVAQFFWIIVGIGIMFLILLFENENEH